MLKINEKVSKVKVDLCPFSQVRSYSGPINILKHSLHTNQCPNIELKFHVKTPYD